MVENNNYKRTYKNKSGAGFTLMEAIIYIALFSILIGTAFITAYQLIESSSNLNVKSTTEEEGNFVMRKFNWAMTGVSPASTPTITGSGCMQSLSLDKTDVSLSPTVIQLNNVAGVNYIEVKEGSGSFLPITTINASVTCLKFSLLSGTPQGVAATTTINGVDFVITKYIRK